MPSFALTKMLFLLLLSAVAVSDAILMTPSSLSLSTACVSWDAQRQQFSVVQGNDEPNALACGSADLKMNETGWSAFWFKGRQAPSLYNRQQAQAKQQQLQAAFSADLLQAEAVGVLEGFLAQPILYNFYLNWFADMFGPNRVVPSQLLDWMSENDKWIQQQVHAAGSSTGQEGEYWRRVALVVAQLNGLAKGYNMRASSSHALTLRDFTLLNLNGDVGDLLAALVPKWEQQEHASKRMQHCSALFAITDDYSDVVWAHTTWANFMTMTRALKEYSFEFASVTAGGKAQRQTVAHSGYPSILYSNDDFYQIQPTRLAVIETTNDVINTALYKFVTPGSLATWVRAIVANSLAVDGPTWTRLFARHNSGTYNNQWMIFDAKLFAPKAPLPPNTFWILEQEPGYTESADVTDYLARGYWPSYNRPFFERTFTDMGYANFTSLYGNLFSYDLAPRANIFRQRAHTAGTVEGMKTLMRYNDWQHDPLSLGLAGESISGRFDLQKTSPNGIPGGWFDPGTHGGIDSKVGSVASFPAVGPMLFYAQSGPTHDGQVPFSWSTTNQTWANAESHRGMPDSWNFDWVEFTTQNP